MLKGINKQIIEIKCTENECFDKILLFVNANKNHLHHDILRKNGIKTVWEQQQEVLQVEQQSFNLN